MDQAGQFVPSADKIQEILFQYGLSLTSFEPATSGIENCTLLVVALAQRYVLRVYRHHRKPDAHIRRELAFIKYLVAAGLPTVPAIANQFGQSYIKHGTWRAILMPFRSGTHPGKYTATLVSQMAQAQATMHQMATNFAKPPIWELPVTKLKESNFLKHIQIDEIKNTDTKGFLRRVKNYRYQLDRNLPKGYCHLDFDLGNVLVDSCDKLSAILDFDDLAHAPYALCLGYTLWSLYLQDDVELFSRYLQEYQKIRQLHQAELAVLPAIMLFRHYTIGAMKVLAGTMDELALDKYLRIESKLTQECYT